MGIEFEKLALNRASCHQLVRSGASDRGLKAPAGQGEHRSNGTSPAAGRSTGGEVSYDAL